MVPSTHIFPLYIAAQIVYDRNRHFKGVPDYFVKQEGYFLIRSIICVIFLIFVLIISLPQYAVLAIIRRKNRQKSAQIGQRFVVWAAKGLTFISGTRVIVRGFENVPADTAVLYVGNHRSIFDILTLYPYLKNNTGFVAKESLKYVPLVGWWMWFTNSLFLNRTDIKKGLQTILDGIDLIKKGTSIVIFPEGTRSKTDDLLPFKEGSLKIAEKSKCPIIPVAITNTEAVFENHLPRIKRASVVIEFGRPIFLDNIDKTTKRHLANHVRDIIIEMRKSHPTMIQ